MKTIPRKLVRFVGGGALFWAMAASSQAQSFNGPIQLIVPFPAGSVTDAQMRALTLDMAADLGTQVVLVYKPGASATLGATTVKTAKPDGLTLTVIAGTALTLPYLEKVGYDPLKDFTYVIGLTGYTYGLIVNANSRFQSFNQYIDEARKNPGTVSFATSGTASGARIAMTQLEMCRNVKFNFVPYKGGAESATALLGGHIDSKADGDWKGLTEAGKARLVLFLSSTRSKGYDSVATLTEICPGLDMDKQMVGIAGPKGMDPAVTKRLHDAFHKAMQTAAYQKSLQDAGQVPIYLNSQDYVKYIEKTFADRPAILRQMGLLPAR